MFDSPMRVPTEAVIFVVLVLLAMLLLVVIAGLVRREFGRGSGYGGEVQRQRESQEQSGREQRARSERAQTGTITP